MRLLFPHRTWWKAGRTLSSTLWWNWREIHRPVLLSDNPAPKLGLSISLTYIGDELSWALLLLTSNFAILPQALACAYLSDSNYWILLNYPITAHLQSCLLNRNCQSYIIVTEITIPPIVNTRATRALRSKQSLTQDSGSPFHSDQHKYSCVPIAKELPKLFEEQVCLPLLFVTPFS